jgi:hypothetical protein
MPAFLPIPRSYTTTVAPIAPDMPGVGVQISHLGIGGYMELPTRTYLYDLPINDNMDLDGYSSAQRKFGMIVYVIDEAKWFQLIPKGITAVPGVLSAVSHGDWMAATETAKRFLLKPDAPPVIKSTWVDEAVDDLGNPIYTEVENADGELVLVWGATVITTTQGTGNPSDCWTELCLNCEGGGLEIVDVYNSATLTSLSANKIFHFHTESTKDLTVSLDFTNSNLSLQCKAGFNAAVMNVGAGMLTLNGVKGVSNVLDAQNSGAFIYVKSAGDAYAVGRL